MTIMVMNETPRECKNSQEVVSSCHAREWQVEPRHEKADECLIACPYNPSLMHMKERKRYGEPKHCCNPNKAGNTGPITI